MGIKHREQLWPLQPNMDQHSAWRFRWLNASCVWYYGSSHRRVFFFDQWRLKFASECIGSQSNFSIQYYHQTVESHQQHNSRTNSSTSSRHRCKRSSVVLGRVQVRYQKSNLGSSRFTDWIFILTAAHDVACYSDPATGHANVSYWEGFAILDTVVSISKSRWVWPLFWCLCCSLYCILPNFRRGSGVRLEKQLVDISRLELAILWLYFLTDLFISLEVTLLLWSQD
jgi:hypothetical protein